MKKESNPKPPTIKKPSPPPPPPNRSFKESELPPIPVIMHEDLGCSYPLPPRSTDGDIFSPIYPPPKRIISEDVRISNIIKGIKKMTKRLSRGSTTKFKVKNIDYPFLMQALSHYEKYINTFKDDENSIIPYEEVKRRSDSLYHTFNIEEE